MAQFTQWALCTPALDVEDVQPLWWGATPGADTDPWFSMVDSELSETPLGTAYLGEVQTLTSQGCPAPAPLPPTTVATSAPPAPKHSKVHRKQTHKAAKRPKRRPAHPHKPARRQPARPEPRVARPLISDRSSTGKRAAPRRRPLDVSPRGRGTYPPS